MTLCTDLKWHPPENPNPSILLLPDYEPVPFSRLIGSTGSWWYKHV